MSSKKKIIKQTRIDAKEDRAHGDKIWRKRQIQKHDFRTPTMATKYEAQS